MVTTVQELIARLRAQPAVAGIVRYGNRPVAATGVGGDLDLFILVDERPPDVESLHFYVGGVPVDLNVRTWRDLEQDEPLTPIDDTIYQGEILYDREGDLSRRLAALTARRMQPPRPLSAHDIAFLRFGQRHSLDSVAGRLDSHPILCRLVLESHLYWAIQHYFLVRRLPYHGEKAALHYLERHEPELWRDLGQFYAASDLPERLTLAEALGEHVLAPVGGLWRQDEVLTFGTRTADDHLPAIGQCYLRTLLGGAQTLDA